MSHARDRIHVKYCPDTDACESIGANGTGDRCKNLDFLITLAEDDRAHREAERLRSLAMHRMSPEKELVQDAADLIDPYEERDGQLVRKSDGKPVII